MSQGPAEAYRDYTVYDQHYEKVGRVDDLFVDENDRPEYIGVKMGLFGTKSTLIPIELVRVNDRRKLVEVAADGETIKHAPTFEDDGDITPEYEHGVHGYFGLVPPGAEQQRSSYGGYYASDADPYTEEELRHSVDTEYGERSNIPERSTETTYSDGTNDTSLEAPDDAARPGSDVRLAGTGETQHPEEPQKPDVEVQGDRNVRVYKRTRTVRG
jgi:PRC-barrel domain protein